MEDMSQTGSIKIAGYKCESTVDGPGLNFVIFMQGCSHRCKDCHNPITWDFSAGEYIELNLLYDMITESMCNGVTLSGGDPMDRILRMSEAEFNSFVSFLDDIKDEKLTIICYTGYYMNELVNDRQKLLLDLYIDILIDGPFEIENKKEIPFRGSTNQNVICITDRGKKIMNEFNL